MYIKINGVKYPARSPGKYRLWWQIELKEHPELELPISGELIVCSDNAEDLEAKIRAAKKEAVQALGDPATDEEIREAEEAATADMWDGVLVRVNTEDYTRQIYENGILILSNVPAPVLVEPTEEELEARQLAALESAKADMIRQSKQALSDFLEANPLTWVDGEQYSVTEEKQNLLTSQLALQSIAAQAGVQRELKWNTTGGVCTEWEFEKLSALALAIGEYVQPLVTYQQTTEVMIQACRTMEELSEIVIDYYTVYPDLRPVAEEPEMETGEADDHVSGDV